MWKADRGLLLLVVLGSVACGAVDDITDRLDEPAEATDTVALPATSYCDRVSEWDGGWASFEEEVLARVNDARQGGGECTRPTESRSFSPSQPLSMDRTLRCAARNHSFDMGDRGFFSHDNPSGESARDRIERAGYTWSRMGENIAVGQATPAQVVNGWLDSFGHCTNILAPGFTEIGIGYYDLGAPHPEDGRIPGRYWTQNFGTPR